MKKFYHKYNLNQKTVNQKESPEMNEQINSTDNIVTNERFEEQDFTYEDVASVEVAAMTYKPTVIENGTVVDGDLIVEGDILIYGQVNGNVTSKSLITLAGKIFGSVACNSAQLDEGLIVGNLSIKDKISMGVNMIVKGDLVAAEAMIEGRILGNCALPNGLLHLHHSGVVVGDVETSRLIIEDNAIIQGSIKVNRDVKFEAL